jgi:hypothetical protein
MRHLTLITLFILLSIGCHHSRVRLDNGSNQSKGEVKTLNKNFWLGGMFPRKVEVDATKLCPSGVYEIDEFYTFKDAALTQLTAGIWVPRTLKITCN